ncbi:MAG: hypothetical protein LBD20_03975 [Spirochaetaceae bacterium]|jgi:hypothetical protein|nr:hypothetical protein [Spirochaetaceae bacterium]
MARFIGSVADYEKYIGPRIKNVVNSLAKKERDKRQGICEFCKKKAELQSAHKHGKERKSLIREALKIYDKGTYIDVDIEKCVNEIKILHDSNANDNGGQLILLPNKEEFRQNLLAVKKANWTIIYVDGREEKGIWNAEHFTEDSDVINNIRSGYLRDWKNKGIMKAIFEVQTNGA